MNMPHPEGIRAVAFDVFGTLTRITERRRPYAALASFLAGQGRISSEGDYATFMTTPLELADIPGSMGYALASEQIVSLEDDLRVELESIRLFDDVDEALRVVRAHGLKTALCSNLGTPYARPVKALLPGIDCYVWSFEAGAIKPDPEIYSRLCRGLDCRPEEILMIGDTRDSDYEGPRSFGIQAWHLSRDRLSDARHVIYSLDEVPKLLPG